ncbi:murein hydrolase activator EnvC family protein [Streptomyces xanthii]|uniref:M23 family metallopeptidase n=1 Tax=Streptomyces xanthii TaxID=2768069 RepID=A0A7H1B546_9ACTN|nr:M23 family metallopeptidase [Streptomyces xanthii]QNS03851.1 M23 family metallopeptidase [Streptomyces xanthii]
MRTLLGVMILPVLLLLVPASARADPADPTPTSHIWPVGERPAIVRDWSPPTSPYGPGHRGVDLAAPIGAPVRTVAAGRVSFAGQVAGRGVVTVELDGSGAPPLRTSYEPVAASVRKGDQVAAGAALGTLELPTGHCPPATPSCLHWGLRRATAYLNPLTLLTPTARHPAPPRLLPLWGPLPLAFGQRFSPGYAFWSP